MKFQNSKEVLDLNYFVLELHKEVALRHVPIIKDVKLQYRILRKSCENFKPLTAKGLFSQIKLCHVVRIKYHV
jgi:hypothetical protein